MAKVDVGKIEGYATMTAEQKLAALESFEIADPDYSGFVRKDLFDKAASDTAKYKKELQAKLTEDEQKEAERQEKQQKLEASYNELLTKTRLSETKAEYLALGYDDKLATATAKAFIENDTKTIFENAKKFQDAQKQLWESEILNKQPGLPGGGKQKTTKEQLIEQYNEAEKKGNFVLCNQISDQIKNIKQE